MTVEQFKTIIRASSLSSYPDCFRRTAARLFPADIEAAGYVLRRPPTGIGAATGTSTHAGAAYMLKTKMETGTLGNAADATQRALQALVEEIAPGVTWDPTSPNLNIAEKQVIRQVAIYARDVAPKIDPEAVEEPREEPLEDGSTVLIQGRVDCDIHRGVRDLKTGVLRRANGYQYGCYSLLRRSRGMEVEFLIEDWIPRVRITKEQPPAEVHYYDVAEAEEAAYAIIKRMVDDLDTFRRTGDPWSFLANPMSMLCSEKYCPAHGTEFCKAHLQDR